MAEEKIIIVPKARPAVDFASNLLVIPKDAFDEYVKEIDKHHVEFIRSLEMSWDATADSRAREAVKMAKEKYEKIIAEKDKQIEELKAYNVVATVDVNPDVVDNLGCTEYAAYDADEVDAVLAEKDAEIRRLQRALWIARATIADSTKYKYHRLSCKAEIDPQPHGWSCYINGEVYRTGKMNRKLEPHYWIEFWEEVERKCRAKAEEYK